MLVKISPIAVTRCDNVLIIERIVAFIFLMHLNIVNKCTILLKILLEAIIINKYFQLYPTYEIFMQC